MHENLALSENGFLFDTRTGNTYSLNRTGTFLLRRLIDGTARDELEACLIDRFDVERETASHDVEQFLFLLRDLRIIGQNHRDRGASP